MPANVRAAFSVVSESFGVENKESCFWVKIPGLLEFHRLIMREHDLFEMRVRLVQQVRVWLSQLAGEGSWLRHRIQSLKPPESQAS